MSPLIVEPDPILLQSLDRVVLETSHRLSAPADYAYAIASLWFTHPFTSQSKPIHFLRFPATTEKDSEDTDAKPDRIGEENRSIADDCDE